ncbi:PREDICTED: LOW QUALITY PROTEIN: pentatricopeptide repeat-containing protein At3g56030 [Tarenaya hassleriana]|uniref:LOW QUALITY PROTEIN: pentatricopeptide repeat-containing protein At3g56030 n=1 Tax=Tarenaya hassleriana TaxID=28532 RepID=UPI00053C15D2|nr:PREDICTED: LOW QUALITY PROTEIN: pentatricopeptide repeat-containing protein At3g56030 [Tarenaya hassleriana]
MSLLRKLLKQPTNSIFIPQSVSVRSFSAGKSDIDTPRRRPTTTHYDNLVYAAGSSGDFDAVRRLLNKRITDACFNTKDTFKFLANTASYSSAVARLCRLGRIEDALIVVDDMTSGGFGATTSTFYPILSVLTKKDKIEEAWRVVDLMRSHALPPDVTAYNYFLTSLCYDGDVVNASKVMRKMEEEGLSPDTRTYDALVLGACRAGKVEAAMVILRRMEDDGVAILYATHAHVIAEMVSRGYYAQAVKFVMAYVGKDERLDTESMGGLASKLIKRKRFEEAKMVLKEMGMRGLRMGSQLSDFYEKQVRNSSDIADD